MPAWQILKSLTSKYGSNYYTIALISLAGKVKLKILQPRLQYYVIQELLDVQAGFRKDRRTRAQIVNIHWIIVKARKLQKNIYFCFIDYAKAFDCVDHSKLWKILKEMKMPDHLICLLRNLYAGQKAKVRTGHGTMDWFQIGKRVRQAVYCHLAYFTYMQSTSWEMLGWMTHKLGSGLLGKISITSDVQMTPPLMAESEEELKSLLTKVKEENEKKWLNTQHSETKDHGIRSHHFTANWWANTGNSDRLYFLGLQNHCRWWL